MKLIGSTSTDSFIPDENLYPEIIKAKEFCNFRVFEPLISNLTRYFRFNLNIGALTGPKTLKLQNSLASIISRYKFSSGIKLSVDVDPISFN